MNTSFPETYFVDGGTLRANTPSYVKRPADDELFEALMNREYCYILTPRQMGKSSLMIRTSQRLKAEKIQSAIVDIQGIGTNKIAEWYASLLSRIQRSLKLSVDLDKWMLKKHNRGFGQMFSDFIQDVVLTEIDDPIVIFLDEVDWMIKTDFRDDFFASIRSMYNARAEFLEFSRISFVLLGVASPADLISEPTRTPFNIGHSIPLQELSLEDAVPLQDGLEKVCPGEGAAILRRIFYWTNGHPYLTQKLCKTIAEGGKDEWSDAKVDELVDSLFLAEESRKEANLKFIQDRILSHEQFAQMLRLYKRVRHNKVKENGQSITQNQLMLSGLLTPHNGYLEVRNRIYQTVFNERWINTNTPKNWQRIALLMLGTIVGIYLVVSMYDFTIGMRLNANTVDFYGSHSPRQRLANLAKIYRINGILSNKNASLSAAQLFYGLQRQDQLGIFTDYSIDLKDFAVQQDLISVISNLYTTVAYVNPENDNTQLLLAMQEALNRIPDNAQAASMLREINFWLSGRQNLNKENYQFALDDYSNAILLNNKNPATTYERALVYIAKARSEKALENYLAALGDLDTTIGLARSSARQNGVDLTPTVTETLIAKASETLSPATITPVLTPTTLTPVVTNATKEVQTTAVPFTLPTPSGIATPQDNRGFESEFSTYIEIVNAVHKLFNQNPGLQLNLPPSGNTGYTNLRGAGLMNVFSSTNVFMPLLIFPKTTQQDADPTKFVSNNWSIEIGCSNGNPVLATIYMDFVYTSPIAQVPAQQIPARTNRLITTINLSTADGKVDYSLPFDYPFECKTNETTTITNSFNPLIEATLNSPTAIPSSTVSLGGADKIAFVANNDIFLMDVDSSNIQQLTNTNIPKFDLQWLPDGKNMLYSEGQCVYAIDITAPSPIPQQIACFIDTSFTGFRVSHDGTQVAISIDSHLVVLPFNVNILASVKSTAELRKLDGICLDYSNVNVESAQWSSDDKSLAILYKSVVGQQIGETIRVITADFQQCQNVDPLIMDEFPGTRFIPTGYDNFPILPSYNWDGLSQFVINTFQRNIGWGEMYYYNFVTHTATQLNPVGTCCYRDARFSPDGTYLLFAFQDIAQGDNAETVLYYVPVGEISTGATFTPIPLPLGFFSDPRAGVETALHPAIP